MAYADETYYREQFHGESLSAERFPYFAERASEYIDDVTFGRAAIFEDVDGVLKKACCAIAEVCQKYEQGGGLVSETVGKMTRNYALGVSTMPTERQALYTTARRYLLHTGLMYLGVD